MLPGRLYVRGFGLGVKAFVGPVGAFSGLWPEWLRSVCCRDFSVGQGRGQKIAFLLLNSGLLA